MDIECAGAVIFVEFVFEGRGVIEDIVQNIGQHFEHFHVGLRSNGCGTRIKFRPL